MTPQPRRGAEGYSATMLKSTGKQHQYGPLICSTLPAHATAMAGGISLAAVSRESHKVAGWASACLCRLPLTDVQRLVPAAWLHSKPPPGSSPPKAVVHPSMLILFIRTAVVDHNVGHRDNPLRFESCHQLLQALLIAVVAAGRGGSGSDIATEIKPAASSAAQCCCAGLRVADGTGFG